MNHKKENVMPHQSTNFRGITNPNHGDMINSPKNNIKDYSASVNNPEPFNQNKTMIDGQRNNHVHPLFRSIINIVTNPITYQTTLSFERKLSSEELDGLNLAAQSFDCDEETYLEDRLEEEIQQCVQDLQKSREYGSY